MCRGTITGEDWQLVELHNRYGNHWVATLQDYPVEGMLALPGWRG